MDPYRSHKIREAVQKFQDLRGKARIQLLISRMTGRSESLLSYEEVKSHLDISNPTNMYIAEIPLDAIVGSVGRYSDFTRSFLPLRDSGQERWARVRVVVEEEGLLPVKVYKLDQVYFVFDGHHRVSVARDFDSKTIEADVIEFHTSINLSPEDDIFDVILKAEHADLDKETQLSKLFPWIDFQVTRAGRAQQIQEHISVHRYFLGIEQEREISQEEAVQSWVEHVYMPVIQVFRMHKTLQEFPGRTETDLYLWLKKHQWELSEEWGKDVGTEFAANNLAFWFSPRFFSVWFRVKFRINKIIKKLFRKE